MYLTVILGRVFYISNTLKIFIFQVIEILETLVKITVKHYKNDYLGNL